MITLQFCDIETLARALYRASRKASIDACGGDVDLLHAKWSEKTTHAEYNRAIYRQTAKRLIEEGRA